MLLASRRNATAAARLSGASPAPPRRLSTVLAFDLAPAGDAVHAALSGQLAALLPGVRATLQGVDAGIFHGHVAVATVTVKEPATLTALRTLIRKAPGLHLARAGQSLRPSDVAGRDDVLCGDLRVDGAEVTAWLVADGLRVAGARAVGDILADLGVLSD